MDSRPTFSSSAIVRYALRFRRLYLRDDDDCDEDAMVTLLDGGSGYFLKIYEL